jgi:hypothetical protein
MERPNLLPEIYLRPEGMPLMGGFIFINRAILALFFCTSHLATGQFSKIADGRSLSGMQCSCILHKMKGEEHFRERPSTS